MRDLSELTHVQDYVIPLTKEVEIEYLMQRLKGTEWE
jgi:chorismate mutase